MLFLNMVCLTAARAYTNIIEGLPRVSDALRTSVTKAALALFVALFVASTSKEAWLVASPSRSGVVEFGTTSGGDVIVATWAEIWGSGHNSNDQTRPVECRRPVNALWAATS
jgi:hypothetical protein